MIENFDYLFEDEKSLLSFKFEENRVGTILKYEEFVDTDVEGDLLA